jgi:hypothetical protein
LIVTVDPATIAALQTNFPNVAQLLIICDPNPGQLNEVQQGSLGGGNVTPLGVPFALTIVPKDSAGNTVQPVTTPDVAPADAYAQALAQVPVQLSLPVLPAPNLLGGVFAWLQAVYDADGFKGYIRPAATFVAPGPAASQGGPFGPADPLSLSGAADFTGPASEPGPSTPVVTFNPLGVLHLRLSVGELQGTLFLPTSITAAYVANFDPNVHIYSGPFAEGVDYGVAGPQYTTFTVVAPQVGSRLFVYNPTTDNYGWIDVSGIGPAPPPA